MSGIAEGHGVIRFGDFALDLRTGELFANGTGIVLPQQLFQLLAMLIAHRGDLVTRDQLRHELWPGDTFVDFEPSLNAAVRRLREVLGDSADTPRFIETLPRRGYRFIAPVNDGPAVMPVAPPPVVAAESSYRRRRLEACHCGSPPLAPSSWPRRWAVPYGS